MATLTGDLKQLTHEVSRELYHISTDVITPKFRYLRIAYYSFLVGAIGSTILIVRGYFL